MNQIINATIKFYFTIVIIALLRETTRVVSSGVPSLSLLKVAFAIVGHSAAAVDEESPYLTGDRNVLHFKLSRVQV